MDLSHWQRMGQRIGDLGWPTSWAGWSDLAGELKGDGWPDPDVIHTAQAQSIHIRVPPRVKVNVWPGWGWQQLWFDFDIREITDQAAATALGHFVHILGEVTQQAVLLSYEGRGEHVFARYNPLSGETTWS